MWFSSSRPFFRSLAIFCSSSMIRIRIRSVERPDHSLMGLYENWLKKPSLRDLPFIKFSDPSGKIERVMRFLVHIAMILLFSSALFGQTVELRGVVTDESGAIVPGT